MKHLQNALQRYKAAQPKAADARNGLHAVPPPIRYTKTRSIDIADALLHEQRVVAGFERGPFVENYKILRTQVLRRLREQNWNVLAVSSPGIGEGKTLTATNLAISLAMDTTQTVLLVDADLGHPRLHTLFGLKEAAGLTEYLLDDTPVEDLLVHPGIGRFVLMPGGRPIRHSVEALTSPKMVSLVEEFRNRYPSRIVVFDLPPLLDQADVLAFSPYADALLLVVKEGSTQINALQRALSLVKGHTPVLGTVLNASGRAGMSLKTMKQLLLY